MDVISVSLAANVWFAVDTPMGFETGALVDVPLVF